MGNTNTPKKADFLMAANNHVRAIWPAPNGRAHGLVQEGPMYAGVIEHRCWVFADWDDYDDLTFDFVTRGLVAGSFDDFKMWTRKARAAGLYVKRGCAGSGFVPLSSGKRIIGIRPGGQSAVRGYNDSEIMLCRIDLPDEEHLRCIAATPYPDEQATLNKLGTRETIEHLNRKFGR